MLPNYPDPITLASVSGGATGLQPDILDIGAFFTPGYPPVISVYISGTATVEIIGALRIAHTNPSSLIRGIDLSGGGFTQSDFYDIIPGIRFYQVNITANNGTVVVEAGFGPQVVGGVGLPQLLRMTNSAAQGT
jgi:hypothetical protein